VRRRRKAKAEAKAKEETLKGFAFARSVSTS
jgi:hypothetical protein